MYSFRLILVSILTPSKSNLTHGGIKINGYKVKGKSIGQNFYKKNKENVNKETCKRKIVVNPPELLVNLVEKNWLHIIQTRRKDM